MRTSELIYDKWGTRVCIADEDSDRLQRFVQDGAFATAAGRGWEILPGPVERVDLGIRNGDEVVAYLWPVARLKNDFDLLGEALDPVIARAFAEQSVVDTRPQSSEADR